MCFDVREVHPFLTEMDTNIYSLLNHRELLVSSKLNYSAKLFSPTRSYIPSDLLMFADTASFIPNDFSVQGGGNKLYV